MLYLTDHPAYDFNKWQHPSTCRLTPKIGTRQSYRNRLMSNLNLANFERLFRVAAVLQIKGYFDLANSISLPAQQLDFKSSSWYALNALIDFRAHQDKLILATLGPESAVFVETPSFMKQLQILLVPCTLVFYI